MVEHFGDKHTLLENTYIPLQLSHKIRTLPATKESDNVLSFIENYRSSLSSDIQNSQEFSYKIFLVPNVSNHRKSSDAALEFIPIDKNNTEDMDKFLVAIKKIRIPVANQGKLRPSAVVAVINENTNSNKSDYWHITMWKKHKVRETPTTCKTDYCQYDEAHKDYVYTQEWVNFLIKKEILLNTETAKRHT